MITELEFKSLAEQGFNRIPADRGSLCRSRNAAVAVPEARLRLGRRQTQLPARVGRRRRAFRALLVHRAAGAHAAALERLRRAGAHRGRHRRCRRRDPRRQPARFHRHLPVALQGGAAARVAALLRRARRLLRLRCGALHRAEAREDAQGGRHRHARHPAAPMRRARGDRQPVRPPVPDRLCEPGRTGAFHRAKRLPQRAGRQAQVQRHRPGGQTRRIARRRT